LYVIRYPYAAPRAAAWRGGRRSPTGIIGHLLDAEVTLGFRIRKRAAEPGGVIVAWDQERWTEGLRHRRGDDLNHLAKIRAALAG
jgi:hypothetical protein